MGDVQLFGGGTPPTVPQQQMLFIVSRLFHPKSSPENSARYSRIARWLKGKAQGRIIYIGVFPREISEEKEEVNESEEEERFSVKRTRAASNCG
ncbi:hypothetical protein CDAR_163731 [Caerostris darwini]|uniref:Uncharacterized protein n=1 Tax=Caerostris darwini TaxID=1538125 RepID=A0AAV4RSC6_9ARAC|nr:hypothetical protein CDAR_163731 [Caerostris darwini]